MTRVTVCQVEPVGPHQSVDVLLGHGVDMCDGELRCAFRYGPAGFPAGDLFPACGHVSEPQLGVRLGDQARVLAVGVAGLRPQSREGMAARCRCRGASILLVRWHAVLLRDTYA